MTTWLLILLGGIIGGTIYGVFLALLADAIRRAHRKRARLAWRQMGSGRL